MALLPPRIYTKKPGRPRKTGIYDEKIHPHMIVEMAREGKTDNQFAAEVGISHDSVVRIWVKEYPEFAEAYKLAMTLYVAQYEEQLRQYLKGEASLSREQLSAIQNVLRIKGKKVGWEEPAKPATIVDNTINIPPADVDRKLAYLLNKAQVTTLIKNDSSN